MNRIRRLVAVLSIWLVVYPAFGAGWETGRYRYDGSGNVKSIGTVEQFRYDELGRLVDGTAGAGHRQEVRYDRYGNIVAVSFDGGPEIAFGVDAQTNQLRDSSKSVFAAYDTAGRITSELGGVGNAFTYDALNTIVRSTVDGVPSIHLYTANEERIATLRPQAGSEGEWTLRDEGTNVVRRLKRAANGTWSWEQDYVHYAGRLLAADVNAPARTLHFFNDHLGSPRLITANGGTKLSFHTYYPFGREAGAAQNAEKRKFTGHERDSASLDYLHARYYNPMWGRFLSPDPSWDSLELGQPQTWNRYTYVENNPVMKFDPDGRAAVAVGGVVAIGGLLIIGGLYLASANYPDRTRTNADVMGKQLSSLFRALARATERSEPLVIEQSRRRREDRRVIGQNMERVYEAAPQLDAKPLIIDINLGVVEGSRQAVIAAAKSGARLFDIGYDPMNPFGTIINGAYSAERAALTAAGYTPQRVGYVLVDGKPTTVYEWVRGVTGK